MRRLQPEPSTDEIPEHLREFDPERYRQTAAQSLREHPGDVWCAAVSVWRAWQHEAQAWQAERAIVRGVKGFRKQLGPGRPPMGWVCDEFALTVNEDSTACSPRCRTHEHQRPAARL
ncbi:hypothetical protein [Streptomyces albicerus]|uniref:hypothetical protein n=1 Tax=Streptomyces albicerus TaxID=2569859 RepID=UPI00124B3294|nr:hypothetical protein [Streptomyces albicerus]